jgi:hypothetical protein
MAFESTSKFLSGSRLVFGSILFVADKMGDLSLKELKLWEITGSDTDHFPPTSAQVGLTCEARLGHGSSQLGESESDPSGDNVNHHEICCPDVADPIYKPSLESKSDGGPKVFMVGKANPPANQTNAEIARAAEAEIARVAQLAWEADKAAEKTHRNWQDDSEALGDEAEDDVASGGAPPQV